VTELSRFESDSELSHSENGMDGQAILALQPIP